MQDLNLAALALALRLGARSPPRSFLTGRAVRLCPPPLCSSRAIRLCRLLLLRRLVDPRTCLIKFKLKVAGAAPLRLAVRGQVSGLQLRLLYLQLRI